MIRTIPPANREALEQGLRRLKLRHMREHLGRYQRACPARRALIHGFPGIPCGSGGGRKGANPKGNPAQVGSVTVSPNPG